MKLPKSANDLISGQAPQPITIPKKGESWTDVVSEELSIQSIDGVTLRRDVVRRVAQLARAGVPWAVEFLANREEGKPKQQVDLSAKEGGVVQVALIRFDAPKPGSEEAPPSLP